MATAAIITSWVRAQGASWVGVYDTRGAPAGVPGQAAESPVMVVSLVTATRPGCGA